jgi:hypothetical protein
MSCNRLTYLGSRSITLSMTAKSSEQKQINPGARAICCLMMKTSDWAGDFAGALEEDAILIRVWGERRNDGENLEDLCCLRSPGCI